MRMVALTEIAEERQPEHIYIEIRIYFYIYDQSMFSFVIHSATPILAARARCMFIISYNYDARIAVH